MSWHCIYRQCLFYIGRNLYCSLFDYAPSKDRSWRRIWRNSSSHFWWLWQENTSSRKMISEALRLIFKEVTRMFWKQVKNGPKITKMTLYHKQLFRFRLRVRSEKVPVNLTLEFVITCEAALWDILHLCCKTLFLGNYAILCCDYLRNSFVIFIQGIFIVLCHNYLHLLVYVMCLV